MNGPERPSYPSPPIEEAVVEFRFGAAPDWDPTVPGKLHAHPLIRDLYTGKPRETKLVKVQASPGHPPSIAVQETEGRVQLVDLSGSGLVSVGPGVLSVSVLRPYPGWDRFRPRIRDALTAYSEIAGRPEITRVGIRYINKIVVPSTTLELRDYFTAPPAPSKGLPDRMNSFLMRLECSYPDGDKLLVTHASVDGDTGTSAFLIDLDVLTENKTSLEVEATMILVDGLHDRLGIAFESVITDKTREVLNGV